MSTQRLTVELDREQVQLLVQAHYDKEHYYADRREYADAMYHQDKRTQLEALLLATHVNENASST